jgi:hypothetical protein
MATESACLLIADISGYTGYLSAVEIDHAQDILADPTNTIVSALRPGFRLAKLEGDAAFTYAITDRIDGSLLLDTIERCYFGFRRRRRDVRQATSCECNACVRIPDLNLKFVVHHGTILRHRVAGRETGISLCLPPCLCCKKPIFPRSAVINWKRCRSISATAVTRPVFTAMSGQALTVRKT